MNTKKLDNIKGYYRALNDVRDNLRIMASTIKYKSPSNRAILLEILELIKLLKKMENKQ